MNSKGNVLFLCGGYRAPYGGNLIPSLRCLEEKLKPVQSIYAFQKGLDKRLWCQNLIKDGHNVEFMDFDAPLFSRIRSVLGIIRRHNIRIIHIHFGDKLAALLCSYLHRNVQVVWHCHSDWSLGRETKLSFFGQVKQPGSTLILRKAKIIAVSKALAAIWNGTYVPNGIASERLYTLSTEQRNAVRASLGLTADDYVAVCFAWSPEVKGLDIAVNAVRALVHAGLSQTKLMIITGPDASVTKKWIAEHTTCSGNEPYLVYCPPAEDVFVYHNAADLLLSPSRSEGFSYTICEALSIGIPCAVSDIPGVSWTKPLKSVAVFPSENPSACADALRKLYDQIGTPAYQQTCKADQAYVLEHYNADNWANAVIDVYNQP